MTLSSLDSLKCISSSNNIIVEIQKQLKILKDRNFSIDFAFVRGHTGVLGNERAYWLAKAATKRKIDIGVNIPKSFYKKITKERMVKSWDQEYLISNKGSITKNFFPTINKRLSCHHFYTNYKITQFLTGHVGPIPREGIHGNEKADFLARTAAEERVWFKNRRAKQRKLQKGGDKSFSVQDKCKDVISSTTTSPQRSVTDKDLGSGKQTSVQNRLDCDPSHNISNARIAECSSSQIKDSTFGRLPTEEISPRSSVPSSSEPGYEAASLETHNFKAKILNDNPSR
ncbi:hypothetical protein TNCV_1262791 [Trichonephila clavipes]|nr:hypothetical protein TNCV_1262791 [Trichonephila clavipes]